MSCRWAGVFDSRFVVLAQYFDEIQLTNLPGQVAKREQAARLALQIFDQRLITHAVQCPGSTGASVS